MKLISTLYRHTCNFLFRRVGILFVGADYAADGVQFFNCAALTWIIWRDAEDRREGIQWARFTAYGENHLIRIFK